MQEESGKKKKQNPNQANNKPKNPETPKTGGKVPPVLGYLSRITATLQSLKYETNQQTDQTLYNLLLKKEVRHLPLLTKALVFNAKFIQQFIP